MIGILTQSEKAQGPPEIWTRDERGKRTKVKNPNCVRPWKDPELLGVGFDLDRNLVKIKEGRRQDLIAEIKDILNKEALSPGHAAKIKGRLFFLTCSLFGRIGRAFMRSISERQYEIGHRLS